VWRWNEREKEIGGPKLRTQVLRLGHCGRENNAAPTTGDAVRFAAKRAAENLF